MVPFEVDDGEGRGEVVISGIPVVSDGGPIVGCILTANYEGNKDAFINCTVKLCLFLPASIGQN